MDKIRVLFVCMGNICRSPLAHAVFEDLVDEAGVSDRFEIESCGTGAWHLGALPDSRMRAEASKHGVDMNHRARCFSTGDEDYFDIILTMDRDNFRNIRAMVDESYYNKVFMFRYFDDEASEFDDEVPDPYYGGASGFSLVYDIVERTCRNLLAWFLEGNFK